LKERAPGHDKEIDGMTFGEITEYVDICAHCERTTGAELTATVLYSLEESVKQNIKFVKESPYIRKELRESAQGFLFDIKTGKVNKIE